MENHSSATGWQELFLTLIIQKFAVLFADCFMSFWNMGILSDKQMFLTTQSLDFGPCWI